MVREMVVGYEIGMDQKLHNQKIASYRLASISESVSTWPMLREYRHYSPFHPISEYLPIPHPTLPLYLAVLHLDNDRRI
jgi:hypothetical protein